MAQEAAQPRRGQAPGPPRLQASLLWTGFFVAEMPVPGEKKARVFVRISGVPGCLSSGPLSRKGSAQTLRDAGRDLMRYPRRRPEVWGCLPHILPAM